MLELLAPAGSFESVTAAVKNGANAVYMGFGSFNARRNAKNFTEEEFSDAVGYCHDRGVKVYAALNTLLSDRELPAALEMAGRACSYGADAIIVQDLGLMRAIREALPDIPIHASTQMSVHSLEGVKKAAELGATRVVLARELSREEIAYIGLHSPIETEVFCHGALCMCYSGQCYMSAVIGRRSGNRGLCAQPCRLNYGIGLKNNEYPLSLKDLCLIEHIGDLEKCGVSCLKIEGRMRRPEYTAIVTGIYSRAIRSGSGPTKKELSDLQAAFSRQGFTDGYFMSGKGSSMFGIREDSDKKEPAIFAEAKRAYSAADDGNIPVRFYAVFKHGQQLCLGVETLGGQRLTSLGPVPQESISHPLTEAAVVEQLSKTGGTPYFAESVQCIVEPGLYVPLSVINEQRRGLLMRLSEKRTDSKARRYLSYRYSPQYENPSTPPLMNISVLSAKQLSPELAEYRPSMLYIPLEELSGNLGRLAPFVKNGVTKVAVSLPPVIHDDERKQIKSMLERARAAGINDALIGNIGQIGLAGAYGFLLHGDVGLNIFNTEALRTAQEMGLVSAALSFELRLRQIEDISKCIDTEIISYGRLPLMTTENCIVKSALNSCSCDNSPQLRDRLGLTFPVLKTFGCRNMIYNTKKIFLADRQQDYWAIGLWAQRLSFTTENARECVLVASRYLKLDTFEPQGCTTGLYYRGVE
jgi:putative protease